MASGPGCAPGPAGPSSPHVGARVASSCLPDLRPSQGVAVLPQQSRMRRAGEFQQTVRHGVRAGRSTLVVHAISAADSETRVGFIVSKAVGNAVTRNRVKRRLRHLVAEQLTAAPVGCGFVVRALPAAATASAGLSTDLAGAWQQSVRRLGSKVGHARGLDAQGLQTRGTTP